MTILAAVDEARLDYVNCYKRCRKVAFSSRNLFYQRRFYMGKEILNPLGWKKPRGYSHLVKTTGGATL